MKDDYDEYYSNDFVDTLVPQKEEFGYNIEDIIYVIELGVISVSSIFALIIFTLWFFSTRPVRIFIYSSMINFTYNLKLIGKLLTCQDPIYDLVSYYLSKVEVSLNRFDYKKYLSSYSQLEQKLNFNKNEASYLLKYLGKLKPDDSLLQLVEKYENELEQLVLSRELKLQNNMSPCYVIGVKEIDTSASSSEESCLDTQKIFPNSQNIEESKKLIIIGEPLDDDKDLIDFDSKEQIAIKMEPNQKEKSLADLKSLVDTKQIELSKDKPTSEDIKEVPKLVTVRQHEEDGMLKIVQPKKLDLSRLLETKDKISKPLKPTVIDDKPPIAKEKPVILRRAEEEKIIEVRAKPKPKPAEEDRILKVEQKKQDFSVLHKIKLDKISKPIKPVAIDDVSVDELVDESRVDESKHVSLRPVEEAEVTKIEQKKEDVSIKDEVYKYHKRVIDADKPHLLGPEVIHRPPSVDKLLKVVGTDRCISCKQNKISPCNHIYRNIRYFDTKSFWEKRQQNK